MIEEHISGEIQFYNHSTNLWETYVNGILSDANVISCSTKNQCCESNKFTIGGVFSGSLQLVCRLPGFSRFQLMKARIKIRSWYGSNSQNARGRGVFWAMQVTRVKDIFTIRGMDAMGWTDVLSPEVGDDVPYFTERITVDGTVGATLGTWFLKFFEPMNDILEARTGIPDLLEYELYDPDENCGIWHANFYISTQIWTEIEEIAYFGIDRGDDGYKTEKPRDVLRWIAEGIGGFITVDGEGVFQMRQFCQPSLKIAEIHDAETEADSLEISDYYIYPKSIYFKYKFTNYNGEIVADSFRTTDPYDEPEFSGFELKIELNAVLDGVFRNVFTGAFQSVVNELFYAFARYEDVDVINGENVRVPSGGDPTLHTAKYKAYPVPFRCKVHKPAFFELGQTVIFPDHANPFNNNRYGKAEHVPYIRSVITEIEWTFRGGTALACGEGESLNMMSLALESKADSVRREVRNRAEREEVWEGTSAEYEEMDAHIPTKLYAAVDEIQTRSRSASARYDASLYIGDVKIGGSDYSAELAEIMLQITNLNAQIVELNAQLTELDEQVEVLQLQVDEMDGAETAEFIAQLENGLAHIDPADFSDPLYLEFGLIQSMVVSEARKALQQNEWTPPSAGNSVTGYCGYIGVYEEGGVALYPCWLYRPSIAPGGTFCKAVIAECPGKFTITGSFDCSGLNDIYIDHMVNYEGYYYGFGGVTNQRANPSTLSLTCDTDFFSNYSITGEFWAFDCAVTSQQGNIPLYNPSGNTLERYSGLSGNGYAASLPEVSSGNMALNKTPMDYYNQTVLPFLQDYAETNHLDDYENYIIFPNGYHQ